MTSTGWGSGRCTGGCGPGGGEALGGGGASVPLVLRLHLCGAGDGESLSLLVDGMDTEVMSWVLRELRAWHGEGRRRG